MSPSDFINKLKSIPKPAWEKIKELASDRDKGFVNYIIKNLFSDPNEDLKDDEIDNIKLHESEFNARCIICDSTDKWAGCDEFIHKPLGAHICMNCGFVTYDSVLKKDEMKEFYRSKEGQYRAAPSVINEYQQERKLHYHGAFLNKHLKKMKDDGREEIVAWESGAAYGRFLHWLRKLFPKGSFHGSELTINMRRVAKNFLNLDIVEDFDDSRKYDLICSYKCAEHVPDIDIELRKQVECLKEDGFVYIGVPVWFDRMNLFGSEEWGISGYYHPNHINMWTRKHFETMLKKVGLEVVDENHIYYDSVYLCKRNDEMMKETPQYEEPNKILGIMQAMLKANKFFENGDYEKAIRTYPHFPQAYVRHYELNRDQLHKDGWKVIYGFATSMIEACPTSYIAHHFTGILAARYKKYEAALTHFKQAVEMKPNDAISLLKMAEVFREMGDLSSSVNCLQAVIKTSAQHKPEAVTWLLHDLSQIPMEIEGNEKESV